MHDNLYISLSHCIKLIVSLLLPLSLFFSLPLLLSLSLSLSLSYTDLDEEIKDFLINAHLFVYDRCVAQ